VKKPVWNWVQCEKRSCRKWRRLPLQLQPKSLPDKWVCNLNSWDARFASCQADEEIEEEVEAEDALAAAAASCATAPHGPGRRANGKLSFRELIFNAEGKLRPPFSERSTVASIFSIGNKLENGKIRDLAAYADSPVYFDAPTLLPTTKEKAEPRTTERCLL